MRRRGLRPLSPEGLRDEGLLAVHNKGAVILPRHYLLGLPCMAPLGIVVFEYLSQVLEDDRPAMEFRWRSQVLAE